MKTIVPGMIAERSFTPTAGKFSYFWIGMLDLGKKNKKKVAIKHALEEVPESTTQNSNSGYSAPVNDRALKRSQTSQESIQNEINLRNTLNEHPQIVTCYGTCHLVGTSSSLVFEYMNNGSLAQFQASNVLSGIQKIQIGLDVSLGLNYLHNHRIIFTDIARDNVLVNGNNRAKLCDLGGAQLLAPNQNAITSHQNDRKFIQVKYGWKAPESDIEFQATGTFSFQSDMYSFGSLLWSLYSETPPFKNIIELDNIPDSEKQKMLNNHEDESRITRPAVKNLVLNLWSRAPSERPSANQASEFLTRELKTAKKEPCEDNRSINDGTVATDTTTRSGKRRLSQT